MEEKLSPAQEEVNLLVENGLKALDDFLKLDQDQVDYIVAKCSVAALDKHASWPSWQSKKPSAASLKTKPLRICLPANMS